MPAAPQGLAGSSAPLSPSLICLDLPQAQTQTAALKNKLALLNLDQSATRDPYRRPIVDGVPNKEAQ